MTLTEKVSSLLLIWAISLSAAAQTTSTSQAYPSRPIRIVMPFPAGTSSNDVLGRALAQRLSEPLGQPVIFDNRAGASGTIGTEMVAKAPPDGYTLLLAITGPLAIAPSVSARYRHCRARASSARRRCRMPGMWR